MIRYDAHVAAWRAWRAATRVPPVDFSLVPAHQVAMHGRLQNWSLYCHGGGGGTSAAPMFRQYQSPARVRELREIPQQVDFSDAMRVNVLVGRLPLMHARSVQWYYVEGGSPARAARRIGFVLADGNAAMRRGLGLLASTVIQARDMMSVSQSAGLVAPANGPTIAANV